MFELGEGGIKAVQIQASKFVGGRIDSDEYNKRAIMSFNLRGQKSQ